MSKETKRTGFMVMVAIVLFVGAVMSGTLLAQRPMDVSGSAQAPDMLRSLKAPLADAAASALTSDQATQIQTLITDFHTATAPTVSAARVAYDNYILAGNATGAAALIQTLTSEQAAQDLARMQALVTFSVGVANVLQNGQLSLLQQKLGADSLVQLIQSLAGGPGGPGGGPGGRGGPGAGPAGFHGGASMMGFGKLTPVKK
ncbi:MAG: hypothetical protein ABSC02_03120 [Acidobacteriota bacterium]|jgi:hypothetical protein